MGSQKTKMGKLILKIVFPLFLFLKESMGKLILKIVFSLFLFLAVTAIIIFANVSDTGKLTPTEAWTDVGKYLIMCLTVLIALFGVAKFILNNKIKPQCKEFFGKIELQFERMNQIKPICAQNFEDMQKELLRCKNEMQTYFFNVSNLQASFGKLEARFDTFEKRFDHLEAKIDKLK